jgi:hypothetical protein
MSAIMHKALNTEAPLPSQISVTAPRPFDGVVRKAMAKRPEDRYSSAAEFLAAIRAAVAAPLVAATERDDNDDATMVSAPRSPGSGAASRAAELSVAALAASIAPAGTGTAAARGNVAGGAAAAGQTAVPGAKKSSALPIMIGGGVAGLAVLGGLGYFLLTGGPSPPPSPGPVTPVVPSTPAPPSNATGPSEPTVPPTATGPTTPPTPTMPPAQGPPPVPNGPLNQTPAPDPTQNTAPAPPASTGPPEQQALGPSPVRPNVPTLPATPAIDSGAAIRTELASFVSRLPCSLLDGDVQSGFVELTGIGGKQAIASLRPKLTAMGLINPAPSLKVTQVDQEFCQWADFLRPLARTFGDSGPRLTLRLAGDPPWLVNNDYIRPLLTMGDFGGELHVDYIVRGGDVQHLYPQLADAKQRVAGDPPRTFSPGASLSLGEHGPDNPGWQVAEPFGTDVIIAIASEDALFDRPRPGNVEKADAYLRDLRRAVEFARSRGARVTATAMPLLTRRN